MHSITHFLLCCLVGLLTATTTTKVSAFGIVAKRTSFPSSTPSLSRHPHYSKGAVVVQKYNIVLYSEPPSDTSSDSFFYTDDSTGVVDTKSEDYTPTASESMVTTILEMMPSSLTGKGDGDNSGSNTNMSSETRAAINEALYQLEALNPTTPQPAMSPLLNGVWELRYVGGYASDWTLPSPTRQLALFLYSGGYSPGIFALHLAQQLPQALVQVVGDVEITISRSLPRVEACVHVKLLGGGIDAKVVVKADLDVLSNVRLRETYESASISGSQVLTLPEPLKYARDLYVTYVDDDLLVVRDGSGVPEVLVRKEKQFQKNWGTDPSDEDDWRAPGES
jgi:PAP_fibrillin